MCLEMSFLLEAAVVNRSVKEIEANLWCLRSLRLSKYMSNQQRPDEIS